MKKIIEFLLVPISIFILSYLLFSFLEFSFDASSWKLGSRAGVMFSTFCFSLLLGVIFIQSEKENNKYD